MIVDASEFTEHARKLTRTVCSALNVDPSLDPVSGFLMSHATTVTPMDLNMAWNNKASAPAATAQAAGAGGADATAEPLAAAPRRSTGPPAAPVAADASAASTDVTDLDTTTCVPDVPTYNVYVAGVKGDMDLQDLRAAFECFGPINSVRINGDAGKRYAFINFLTPDGQANAVQKRTVTVKDRKLTCYISEAKKTIFVSGINWNLSGAEVRTEIEQLTGPMQSIVLKTGFCFCTYETQHRANQALAALRNAVVAGFPVKASFSRAQRPRDPQRPSTLFVRNLDKGLSEEDLHRHCAQFGTVVKVTVARLPNRESRGFAFVQFASHEEATSARDKLTGSMIGTKPVFAEFSRSESGLPNRHGRRGGRQRSHQGSGGRRGGRGGSYRGRRRGDGGSGPPGPAPGPPSGGGNPPAGPAGNYQQPWFYGQPVYTPQLPTSNPDVQYSTGFYPQPQAAPSPVQPYGHGGQQPSPQYAQQPQQQPLQPRFQPQHGLQGAHDARQSPYG